jgi:hypothetical protein
MKGRGSLTFNGVPGNLADGEDRFQSPMLQAPFHDVLHSVMHPIPTAVEALGHFLPGELARPVRRNSRCAWVE